MVAFHMKLGRWGGARRGWGVWGGGGMLRGAGPWRESALGGGSQAL